MNKKLVTIFEIISLIAVGFITYRTTDCNLLVVSLIMNISGLLSVFMARRKDWFYPIFGLIFAFIYMNMMFNMNVLGEAYFNKYIVIPMLIIGLYQNLKNLKEDNVHFKDKHINNPLWLVAGSVVAFGLTLGCLLRLGSTSAYIDATSTTFALMGTILLNLRYNSQSFWFWSMANLTNLVLHLTLGNYSLCVIFGIYLINGLIALTRKG